MEIIKQLLQQRSFFESGSTKSYQWRIEQLTIFKQGIIANEKAINEALFSDLRKTPEECWVSETGLLLQEINYTIEHLRDWMQPKKVDTNILNLPSSSYLYPSSKGVVLIIGPWNFPLQLLLIPFVGAIAAGNCVVLKPSEHAPAMATLVEKIITDCFHEKTALVVQGDGAEVIPKMMNQFRFDHVFYTGSIPVGRSIYQMAAKELVPVTLELGGKDPCIVEEDANLKVAARRIAVGKFTNAGQMCVSPDYLLVKESVKNELIDHIKVAIEKFYTKSPATTEGYGKIINERRFDKLISYLSQGKIIYGGEHQRDRLYIGPTLMEGVSLESPIMQEEIFGPILPIISFKEESEAMEIIRRNPNPLSFYIFSNSKELQEKWLELVQFGAGCVNNTVWQFSNHHLPFGGIGQSGIGGYHGKASFDSFTHVKSVMKTPTWFDPDLKYPPMKGKLGLLKMLVR